jgi:leucine-rich repeat protein SHOC2
MKELAPGDDDLENLSAEQKICLEEIAHCIGRPMRRIKTISWDSVGYMISGGAISGLALYGCGIDALPRSVDCLSELKHINLRRNNFVEVPVGLAEIPGIEIVSVERNQLASLPHFKNAKASLRALYASHNNITLLREDIGVLAKLEVLDLDQNRITALPDSIGDLVSLTDLNLGSKKVSTLADPDIYGEEPLTKYLFGGNPPRSPFELQAILLRQTFNHVESLPASMGFLRNLQNLSVVSNHLQELPGSLRQMSRIREIDVSYNQLRAIPAALSVLPRLEVLDVSYNLLSEIPEGLSNSATLRRLITQGNRLGSRLDAGGFPWHGAGGSVEAERRARRN